MLALVGASALGYVALSRGENINALWIVVAAISVYLIAYRFYSRFIADKVLGLDPTRKTPAWQHNDGLDYVPTNKYVLFGHHFAAIAGAGPLVGPVLAAQMGYLPGMLWILAGVVFAGAVQDLMVLFVSVRTGPHSRRDRAVRLLHDHDYYSRSAGSDRCESLDPQPVGYVYGWCNDSDCVAHGRLHALCAPWPHR
jgi:carbon starvation protein